MRILFFSLMLMLLPSTAMAQFNGGVFGPVVNEGSSSAQYRAAYNPDTEAFSHRGHYQMAISDTVQLRGVVQFTKPGGADLDYDLFQGEATFQITPDGQDFQFGVRTDVTLRDGPRPDQVGLNTMSQWKLNNGLSAKFVTLASVQGGDRAADGIDLQTRASLSKGLPSQGGIAPTALSLELYSFYGRTGNLADFNDQTHLLGPSAKFKITDSVSTNLGALFGLTDASADSQIRLWVTKGF